MNYYSPLTAILVTLLSTAFVLRSRFGNKVQDIPNERSLHATPIPRIGGVGLIAGVMAGWALVWPEQAWWLVLPVLGLFAVSLLDDMHGLPVRLRLPIHLAAAAVLVGGAGLFTSAGVFPAIVALLVVVWMTNLFNFMDGSDGLAGGMALFGFGFYGVAAWHANEAGFAALNFCIVASALGFLYFNLRPAKVFMGDAGSIPLGFLVAGMGLWGWMLGCWPAWFPPVVFSPFVVDATVTLARRSLRGARITEAHREHYYQRVIQMGWSHRELALAEYVLMLVAGMLALWSLHRDFPWLLFIVAGGLVAGLMVLVDIRWIRFQRRQRA